MRSRNLLALAVLVFVALACSQGPQTESNKPEKITSTLAQASETPAKAKALVTDDASVLSAVDKADIEKALADLKRNHKVEFAVTTIETTNGKTLESHSLELARDSGIGEINGGAFLVLAIKERNWWIQIDKTLEKGLSDDEVGEIGAEMKNDLKAGNYAAGIKKCIKKMSAKLAVKQNPKS